MDNISNPNFGSGSGSGGLANSSKLAFDAAECVLRSNSNNYVPTGFHAALLHTPPSEVVPASPVQNEHLRQVVHRIWNSPVVQHKLAPTLDRPCDSLAVWAKVVPTSPVQNEHLRQVVHRIWNSPVVQPKLNPMLDRPCDSLAVWAKSPDAAATSPRSPCGDKSPATGIADVAEWQGWQKLAQATAGNDGMDVANLGELRTFMTNQFEGLRADLHQQHAVAESLRQQLSHEMRQSALLLQQLQHLSAMHQSQLAEVNAAHGSETAMANAKIGGLVSQVRQLTAEKSACQAQLTSQQEANAQQVWQMDHLRQLLQYTQSQLSAARTQPSAAAGSPAEQVEQLKQQLQEAQQEAIRAERRSNAYQAQLAVEISELERATVAHKSECEAAKSENAALNAELESAKSKLKDLQKQVAESLVPWGSTCI